MKKFEDIIDEIIANMDKQRESAIIKAFVTNISMMLRANGVIPYMSEVTAEIDDNDALKTVFCCRLEKLDFTEHDKVFEDKIKSLQDECAKIYKQLMKTEKDYQVEIERLKQRISELEIKETVDLPFDPLECANYLINATYERETNGIERAFHNFPEKVNSDRYTVDDLEQIAEHLLVYCKHNKELE